MFTVPSAVFYEAVLSFIGLGIQVPNASLGRPDRRRRR
jgi:oligopeptide transport system permease protein